MPSGRSARRPGFAADGDRDAGARTRRERRHVQRHPRGAAPAAAVSRARGAREDLRPRSRDRRDREPVAGRFLDFASETTTLERTGAHGWIGFFTVADRSGAPERIGGVNVTEGFFPTLGASFVLGRPFIAEEDGPNAPMTVVLSHGFWQRRYGGDSSVIGRAITLNARPATIVGVLAASFRHVEANPEREADVYVPYGFATTNPNRGGHFIRAVGRLKAGATTEQARAELVAIATRLEQQYPTENTNRGVEVAPPSSGDGGRDAAGAAPAGWRGWLRAAGRVRQPRQPAARAGCLATIGARGSRGDGSEPHAACPSAGDRERRALGTWRDRGSRARRDQSARGGAPGAAGVPRAEEIRIDGMVLGFAALLALVTGVVSGLVPALQVSRGDLNAAVRDGGRGSVRPGAAPAAARAADRVAGGAGARAAGGRGVDGPDAVVALARAHRFCDRPRTDVRGCGADGAVCRRGADSVLRAVLRLDPAAAGRVRRRRGEYHAA